MREEGRAVARQLELDDEGLHDEGALAAGCVPAAVVVAGDQWTLRQEICSLSPMASSTPTRYEKSPRT